MTPDRLARMKSAFNELLRAHNAFLQFGQRSSLIPPDQAQAQAIAIHAQCEIATRSALLACLEGLIEMAGDHVEVVKGENGKSAPLIAVKGGLS